MKLFSIFVGVLSLGVAAAQKGKARSNDEKIRIQAVRNREKLDAKKAKLQKIFDAQAEWFKENVGPGTDKISVKAKPFFRKLDNERIHPLREKNLPQLASQI